MSKCVTHLIVGLGKGGAETMLYQVLKYRSSQSIEYKVISMGASHFYEQPVRDLGISVVEVPFRNRPLSSLIKICREVKGSDTLCCWMYHANLIGAITGKIVGVKRIVWNIRHSNLEPKYNKCSSLFINNICAKLSKNIDVIAYNGEKARVVHEEVGYCESKGIVLNNGVDCEEFCPNDLTSVSIRTELQIQEDKRIILSVSRYDPIKDIPLFIESFARLHQIIPDTVALMCGDGITIENQQIVSLCRKNKLIPFKDIFLLGMRNDIPRMLAGCNLYVLHSAGEAFPNTLIQAMSCGCICVATDVGDVNHILNDGRWIVPTCDSNQLSTVMEEALELSIEDRQRITDRNRTIVLQNYNIKETVKKYEEQY